jgi:hypothetical protein
MGLATAACKKLGVKSLPKRGFVVPLRRGPDGFEFWLQGTMLKVAPVSTRYLSLVNSSDRKINPALAGKCIAMAVACVGMAAKPKVAWCKNFLLF